MSVGFIFWFVWLLVLVWSIAYHGWGLWADTFGPKVNAVVIMLLFFCVGWGVFGPPIRG